MALFICVDSKAETQSYIHIQIQDKIINLKAERMPLQTILDKISAQTGLILNIEEKISEIVSCECAGIIIDECMHKLLANQNYAMIYSANSENQSVLSEIWINGAGNSLFREDPSVRYSISSLAKEMKDERHLLTQISGVQTSVDIDSFSVTGLKVRKISKDSAFEKIGLEEGEIVTRIAGEPVYSAEDIVRRLKKVINEDSMIQIERYKRNGKLEPIYIRSD